MKHQKFENIRHLETDLFGSLLEYEVILLVEIDLAHESLLRGYEVSDLTHPLGLLHFHRFFKVFKGLLHQNLNLLRLSLIWVRANNYHWIQPIQINSALSLYLCDIIFFVKNNFILKIHRFLLIFVIVGEITMFVENSSKNVKYINFKTNFLI